MMNKEQGQLDARRPTSNSTRVWNVGMVLLALYILFNYIAQETLLPPVIHSVTMYAFLVWTAWTLLRRGKVPITTHLIWQLAVLAFSALSMLWAEEKETAALYDIFVGVVLSYCFVITLDSRERLENCLLAFVIAADVLSVTLFLTNQISMEEAGRLGEEITGNANSFSSMLMVSAIFAVWLFIYKKGFIKYFSLVSGLLCLFIMGLSGGRKTVLVVVVCLIYLLVFRDTKKTKKMLGNLVKIVAILVVFYIAVMKIPLLYNAIGYRFAELFKLLSGGESAVSSDPVRITMIKIGMERWTESPIWGYGLDTYKYYNQTVTGRFYYAHNNYVELLYDLGLIGFVLYYYFYVHVFRKLLAVPESGKAYKSLGIMIILGLLTYDFGGISYYAVFMQIVLAIAFVAAKLGKTVGEGTE